MEAGAAQSSRVLHQDAAGFTARTRGVERRMGLLFTATGIGLVVVMGVLGPLLVLFHANFNTGARPPVAGIMRAGAFNNFEVANRRVCSLQVGG